MKMIKKIGWFFCEKLDNPVKLLYYAAILSMIGLISLAFAGCV